MVTLSMCNPRPPGPPRDGTDETGLSSRRDRPRPAAPEFDDDAAATTELRRQKMQAASGHFRALDAILRGDAAQKEQVTLHAEAFARIVTDLDTVFAAETPHAEGALGAGPRIWDAPESLERHLVGLRAATADLAAAAAAGRAYGEDLLAARYQSPRLSPGDAHPLSGLGD